MAKLKVYGGCYDGQNRLIVAATSLKAAHGLVTQGTARHIPFNSYRLHTAVTGNQREVEVATGSPGTVFSAKNDYHSPFNPISNTH